MIDFMKKLKNLLQNKLGYFKNSNIFVKNTGLKI